jgi:hypothetical protein
MIPSANSLLLTELEVKTQPSRTYKMHLDRETISGSCDGQDAMAQAIYKILNSERYEALIYSWDYGIELKDLFGEPISYVCPELQRRIEEALMQDDRITSVTDFEFDISEKRTVKVSFTVHTIYGDIETEKAVNY